MDHLPAADPALLRLVAHLRTQCGDQLYAVVLFGSAAEGKQRAVSDTNLVIILRTLDAELTARLRGALALDRVALRLQAMLLRVDELPAAAAAFAVKFADIKRRHLVLYGADPFAELEIPRAAAIAHVRQSALNQVLRLRSGWATAIDDHALAMVAAEAAGGLRACAAEILELVGTPAATAREALEHVAGGTLPGLRAARDGQTPAEGGAALLTRLLASADELRTRAERLA